MEKKQIQKESDRLGQEKKREKKGFRKNGEHDEERIRLIKRN